MTPNMPPKSSTAFLPAFRGVCRVCGRTVPWGRRRPVERHSLGCGDVMRFLPALTRALDDVVFADEEHARCLAAMLLSLRNKILNQTQRRDSSGRWV